MAHGRSVRHAFSGIFISSQEWQRLSLSMMLSKKGGSNASERKGTSRNVKRIAADAYVEKDQQVIKLIVCGLDESFDAETC